jgi:hypothetical protein
LRELATWKSNHPEHTEKDLPHGVGTELLNRTYAKMGNTVLDGKKVCPSPFCLGVQGELEVPVLNCFLDIPLVFIHVFPSMVVCP